MGDDIELHNGDSSGLNSHSAMANNASRSNVSEQGKFVFYIVFLGQRLSIAI